MILDRKCTLQPACLSVFIHLGGTPFSAIALLVGFSLTKDITKGTHNSEITNNCLNGNEIQIQTRNWSLTLWFLKRFSGLLCERWIILYSGNAINTFSNALHRLVVSFCNLHIMNQSFSPLSNEWKWYHLNLRLETNLFFKNSSGQCRILS
jgi:hypothetical protein